MLVSRASHSRRITGIKYSAKLKGILVNTCDNKIRIYTSRSLILKQVFFHQHSTYSIKGIFVRGQVNTISSPKSLDE